MNSSDANAKRLQLLALVLGLGLASWIGIESFSDSASIRPTPAKRGAETAESLEAVHVAAMPRERAAPKRVAAESTQAHDVARERPLEVHPMDDARQRIARENQLIQSANDAVDSKRAEDLRRVLELYREHDPDDKSGLQLGYGVIADCLDAPGAVSRAAGERFIAQHRVSILRRFVRRHCLASS